MVFLKNRNRYRHRNIACSYQSNDLMRCAAPAVKGLEEHIRVYRNEHRQTIAHALSY